MTQRHEFRGKFYTIKELSDLSGLAPATLRDRLRRGYSVEQAVRPKLVDESVEQFCEASWWEDWIDMPISALHKIYWKWCVSHGYTPLPTQPFSRHLMSLNPQIKTVPSRVSGICQRVIRGK